MIVASVIFADHVSSYDPLTQNPEQRLSPPSLAHYFGTDGLGRDVFSRVLHGGRISLGIGFVAATLSILVGISLGLSSVFYRGVLDLVLQRFIDVVIGFPFLVTAVVIIVAAGPSPGSMITAIAVFLAPHIARLCRAATLPIVEGHEYIQAARALGCSRLRLILFHILPNSLPPVGSQIANSFGIAIVCESAVSFLGLGIGPPFPSWGRMLYDGAHLYFEVAPWVALFPTLAIVATVGTMATFSDRLIETLDPLIGTGNGANRILTRGQHLSQGANDMRRSDLRQWG